MLIYNIIYYIYISMFSSKLARKYKYSILSINNFIKIYLILLIIYKISVTNNICLQSAYVSIVHIQLYTSQL